MNTSSFTQHGYGVQEVQFADGTVWSRQQLLAMVTAGTSGNDNLYGGYMAEVFDGKGAPAGSQDYEQGSANADTFMFNDGYGHLEIYEFNVFGGNNTLQLGAGITAAQVTVTGDSPGNISDRRHQRRPGKAR